MTWDFAQFLQRTLVSIISSSIVHKKNGCDNLHSVLVEPVSRFQPKLRNCLSNHGWVQCSSSSLTFDQIIVPFAATPVGWLKWVVQSIGTTFGLYGLGLPIGFPSIVMDDLAWSLMKCLSLHFSSDISDNNAERIDNSETINLTLRKQAFLRMCSPPIIEAPLSQLLRSQDSEQERIQSVSDDVILSREKQLDGLFISIL